MRIQQRSTPAPVGKTWLTVEQDNMTSNTELRLGDLQFARPHDGIVKCSRCCHERGGSNDSLVGSFHNGTVDACGHSKVVGVDDKPAHGFSVASKKTGPRGRPRSDRSVFSYVAAGCTSSTSIVIVISSPTMGLAPPTPKSLRLIVVEADAPTCWLPRGSLTGALGPSTSSTTSLVVPWIVRSPVIFNLPVPAACTDFDLKVIVGYFATSK